MGWDQVGKKVTLTKGAVK
ncbi:hypothetical protein [Paenibacillus alvei]|uniref:Uncharacterized protein n=1 Tax=Paenibacillus alvei TaxID=44250 RepID=A0ABT4H797_PAEAL|nr:hypothetical protein [Paenibacillus alvei]